MKNQANQFSTAELINALEERGFGVLRANSSTPTLAVLTEVRLERARQDAKWGEQNHPMLRIEPGAWGLTSPLPPAEDARELCQQRFRDGVGSYFDVLFEEVCEAHDAAFVEGNSGKSDESSTRAELLQVAAVAVAMIETIDRRRAAEANARATERKDG